MRLTPAAANLLVIAGDRADRMRRRARLVDMRACLQPDGKQLTQLLRDLKD